MKKLNLVLIAAAVAIVPMTTTAQNKHRINTAACECTFNVDSDSYDCIVGWDDVVPTAGPEGYHVHVTSETDPFDSVDDAVDVTTMQYDVPTFGPMEGVGPVDGEDIEIIATFNGVTFPPVDPDSEDTEPDQTIVAKVAGVGNDSEHGNATQKLKANVHCTLN